MVSGLSGAIVVAGIDPSQPGAGLYTDLAVMRGCGVSAHAVKTAWAAQHPSSGLSGVIPVGPDALGAALSAACAAQPDAPVKLGMLADAHAIVTVQQVLAGHRGPLVADPVTGPSAGGSWANAHWLTAYRSYLLPQAKLLTPNLAEARLLCGDPDADMQQCSAKLAMLGCAQSLITGGDVSGKFSCDYLRIGDNSYWLCAPRLPGTARGTGCTLTSAIAAALALGYSVADACVIGKLASMERIAGSVTGFPSARYLPIVCAAPLELAPAPMPALEHPLGVCPIVSDPECIAELGNCGADTIQLRLTDAAEAAIPALLRRAAELAVAAQLRLFINDYWQQACAAVAAGVRGIYGVHLGQQDLDTADLGALRAAQLRLGVSVHSWHEAAVALAAAPSYLSFGPVYQTSSKQLTYDPLGTTQLAQMCADLPVPSIAIGGITAAKVAAVASCGVSGIATIAASDTPAKLTALTAAWCAAAVK